MNKPRPPHMGKSYFRHPPEEFTIEYGSIVSEQKVWCDDYIDLPKNPDHILVFEKRYEQHSFGSCDEEFFIVTKTKNKEIRNSNYEAELAKWKADKAVHDKLYDDYEAKLAEWEKEQRRLKYESLKKEFE